MPTFTLVNKNMTSTVAKHTWIIWCMRLDSALRTAFACAIVGGVTLYGPKFLTNHLKFAAFSYLTAVLIVSDARLGDTFRGWWHAFCATAQVVPLAMLGRWMIEPNAGLPVGMSALVVGVASFLVALPESTHLTAKRIAFGQIVLVCSDAVMSIDGSGGGYVHPLHVAASTTLGALASVLALMLPFPGMAYYKVKELRRLYGENASERMCIYLRAFDAPDDLSRRELISQAKPIAETGTKLLQCIDALEEGIRWERPRILYGELDLSGLGDRLQRMELAMRGIEYSLVSSLSFPVQVVDQQQISNVLEGLLIQLKQKIDKVEPEIRGTVVEPKLLSPLEPNFPIDKYEWVFFFFSCIDMLLNNSTKVNPNKLQTQSKKTELSVVGTFKTWILKLTSRERLEFAFKCSLSLGLAVLFGLIIDKENGCWAGLTIAISFVTGKQAIFTVANTRAQGTAIGSAYGVICCFLFHHVELRFLALLPWIIFTSFLRHSRMYGQTGGISAAIGALLILGRKNYGAPTEFAIIRLAEVFIGLSCFILVELFMQPTRAATLTKSHLFRTLCALQDCIKQTTFYSMNKNTKVPDFLQFRDEQKHLKSLVCELKKLLIDADLEPDFWYLPFRTSCYNKMVGSLSNIMHMLYFIKFNVERLSELPKSYCAAREEALEHMNSELKLIQEALSSTLKCLDQANLTESQADFAEAVNEFCDLEAGKLPNPGNLNVPITEDEAQKNTEEEVNEDKKQQNESDVGRLGAIRFCITSLRREIVETEISVKEIVKWQNYSSK